MSNESPDSSAERGHRRQPQDCPAGPSGLGEMGNESHVCRSPTLGDQKGMIYQTFQCARAPCHQIEATRDLPTPSLHYGPNSHLGEDRQNSRQPEAVGLGLEQGLVFIREQQS